MVSPCTLWMTRSAGRAHRVGATPSGFLPARCSASSCSMMVGSLIIASRMPLKRSRPIKGAAHWLRLACARSSAFMLERLPNGERMDDAFQMGAICSSGGSDGPCGHNRNAASVAQPRGDNASTECSTTPHSRIAAIGRWPHAGIMAEIAAATAAAAIVEIGRPNSRRAFQREAPWRWPNFGAIVPIRALCLPALTHGGGKECREPRQQQRRSSCHG